MELELAQSILSGMTRPFGIGGYFNPTEWHDAAQYATETGDWSEISFMQAHEAAWQEFGQLRFTEWDFDDYCDRYAPEAAKIGV